MDFLVSEPWGNTGKFPASESPPGEDPRWRLSTVNSWIDRTYGGRG